MIAFLKAAYLLIPKWMFAAAALAMLALNIAAGFYILGLKTELAIAEQQLENEKADNLKLTNRVKAQNDAIDKWKTDFADYKKAATASIKAADARAARAASEAVSWQELANRKPANADEEYRMMREDIDRFIKQRQEDGP